MKNLWEKVARDKIFFVVAVLLWGYVMVRVMSSVVNGSIPFWYDPARDLMTAKEYWSHFGLIGPPTGIPGLFYGPYWIWMLMLPVKLFGDPRWVLFWVQVVPYLVGLPLLLGHLSRVWGKLVSLAVGVIFGLSYLNYILFLWNPHLAPLLFLLLIVLVTKQQKQETRKTMVWDYVLMGVVAGLIVNFHFPFGVAMVLGTSLWLMGISFWRLKSASLDSSHSLRMTIKKVLLYLIGVGVVFGPFGVFEVRHGFNQTKALVGAVSGSFLEGSNVVGQEGISKAQALNKLLGLPSVVFKLPGGLSWVIWALLMGVIVVWWKKSEVKNISEILDASFSLRSKNNFVSVLSLVISVWLVLLGLLFLSNNPVWEYHFIGMEMMLLIIMGVVASRVSWIKWFLVVMMVWVVWVDAGKFKDTWGVDAASFDSLAAKELVVETIYEDAGNMDFAVTVYTPAVYIPDYEYLLWWKDDDYGADWVELGEESSLVYVVLPWTEEHVMLDYLNYKTPNDKYETIKKWEFKSGLRIFKRELKVSLGIGK